MPRLLFFAYPFPPSPAIGAVRAWAIAKHMSRVGWEVTVVTPRPIRGFVASAVANSKEQCCNESIDVVYAGRLSWQTSTAGLTSAEFLHGLPRRILSRILRSVGVAPDELWVYSALRASIDVRPGAFDLVLATGSPFSSFIAAWRWGRRLNVPFVLDYRDPWSLNKMSRKNSKLVWWLEKRILGGAARLIMVSPSQAAQQQQEFNLDRRPLILTNGYDPELLAEVSGRPFEEFAIVYAGEFYQGQREVDPLLLALKRARDMGTRSGNWLRLHYYGSATDYVLDKARQIGVEALVVCHGRVPRSEVLSAIKGCDVAAVITGVSERADLVKRGIVTGKLFEPLGLGVPLLLIAPEDSDARTIVESAGAGKSFRASEIEAMADWLIRIAEEDRGARSYSPPSSFSWPVLAKKLNEEMHALLRDRVVQDLRINSA